MRLLIAMLLLSVSAIGQDGIPTHVGNGELPPGLEGVTDLPAIQQSQFDALRQCVEALQFHHGIGLTNISDLQAAQTELSIARLGATDVMQERLDFIQEALVNALKSWQRIRELQKGARRGGEAASETQARAAVFRYRAMWLKEKARDENDPKAKGLPAIGQEDILTHVGNGELPPGLDGVTDLHAIQQSQMDALRQCVEALRIRFEGGLISIDDLLDAQTELAIARLEMTNVKQERLDFIQEALVNALKSWQRIRELQKAGMRGGEAASETQARAAVFRYRIMWLKEKAGDSNEPTAKGLSAIGRASILTNVGNGELPPGLDGVTDLHAIQQSQMDALRQCVEALRIRFEGGLISIDDLLDAQTELAIARLEMTNVKQERLDFIQVALVDALKSWQRIHELQKAGVKGGEVYAETQARAAVFRYRVMWLKENARDNN